MALNQDLVARRFELEKAAFVIRSSLQALVRWTYAMIAEPFVPLRMSFFHTLEGALEWHGLGRHAPAALAMREALRDRYRAAQLRR